MSCLKCDDWDKETKFCRFAKCNTDPWYDCHGPEFEDGPGFEGWEDRCKGSVSIEKE